MHVNFAAFGWHATVFFNGWVLLLAGSALVTIAVLIFKIVYGGAPISN